MAEVVLRAKLAEAGLSDRVVVDSAGTGDWHVGEPADHRTIDALAAAGYDGSAHRATWLDADWLDQRDLVLVADHGHLSQVRRLATQRQADPDIRLLRSFDPAAGPDADLADPYYGDASHFETCLQQVEAACSGLVQHLAQELR
ncbi:low molecular weight protein-tyrosine-phosphatase [Dermacoccaceae bacterium W4C1]